jgi:hypothetical protein
VSILEVIGLMAILGCIVAAVLFSMWTYTSVEWLEERVRKLENKVRGLETTPFNHVREADDAETDG